MYATNYHRAASVSEAASLFAGGAEAQYVSGGMTLIPTMKQRLAAPGDLVDLRHIPDMKGIAIDGRRVRIGAAVTHAEVAASSQLATVCPAICRLAGMIGDPHVRHMGTIGGSVANNDPAADYPAAMLALAATIVTSQREIAADDFFTGLFETALEEGEIVVALIDDSEATLKYFRREGAMIRLDPANRSYDPQRYAPAQVRVQGKLAGLLRRYD